jgi:predicted acyltransferase
LSCWYFTTANPACRALLPSQADTFALPAQFVYGNLGRNTLRGDRQYFYVVLAYVLVCWAAMWVLYRKGIFLKI